MVGKYRKELIAYVLIYTGRNGREYIHPKIYRRLQFAINRRDSFPDEWNAFLIKLSGDKIV